MSDPATEPSLAEWAALLRAEMRRRWRRGEAPRAEACLEGHAAARDSAEVVLDLIEEEARQREERGEAVDEAEFIRRFPDLAAPIRRRFALHRAWADGSLRPAPPPAEPVESHVPPTLPTTTSAPVPGPESKTERGTGASESATLPPPPSHAAGQTTVDHLDEAEDNGDSQEVVPIDGGATVMQIGPSMAALGAAVGAVRIPGYEVEAELGRGGMGVVYKARQVGFNRLVALKMLLSGAHAGPDERERFLREAESVARLRHPGIVDVYAFGELDGCPYFSLEYLEGGSLADRLGGRPLPPREAAGLTAELARTIHYAHREGIVHRDLKPANVLLTADGRPKITDFGLAKNLDVEGRTQTGAVMGTPGYMAPEQAEGKSRDIGPHTDVYALGAVLYEMLTGRPPFRAATTLDTLLLVLSAEPVPPRDVNPQAPADLEAICLKCLAKSPEQRYASARRLAEDLDCYLKGEAPIHAKPAGGWRRWNLWAWRNTNLPMWALIAGAAVLLITTPFGGVYFPLLPIAAAATAALLLTRPKAASLALAGATLIAGVGLVALFAAVAGRGVNWLAEPWVEMGLGAAAVVAVLPLIGLLLSRAERYLCLALLTGTGLAAVGWILAGDPIALAGGLLTGLVLGGVSRVTARLSQTPVGVALAGTSLACLLNPCGCGPLGPLVFLMGLAASHPGGAGGGMDSLTPMLGFAVIYIPIYAAMAIGGAAVNVWIYRSLRRRLWERAGYVATVRRSDGGPAAG